MMRERKGEAHGWGGNVSARRAQRRKPDGPGRLELPVGRRTWRRGTERRSEELAGCTKDSGLLLRGDVTRPDFRV